MHKKIKVTALPDFDPAEYLKDEADIAAYLTAILEDGDPALLAAAEEPGSGLALTHFPSIKPGQVSIKGARLIKLQKK